MLVYGEIVSINGHKARVKLKDFDGFETDWVQIPQLCTYKDKSSNVYEIGTEVALLINSDFDDGCIIGAIYNDEDVCITDDKNIKMLKFSDGSLIQYDKESHKFTLDIKSQIDIKAAKVVIDGDLEVKGNVSDSVGTMQNIRDIFNSHTHGNGNNGANTSAPNSSM